MPIVDGQLMPLRLPEKHARVLLDQSKPWRYRVLHGGRNGAKDWSAASVAIEKAARTPIRVLCTREIQKTIKDSTHQLLCDTIKRDGFSRYFFTPTENSIKSRVGANFIFSGLRDISADNLKSLEGVDIVILGEAQSLSEKSWNILDPTIRKPGSEIWIIYNDQFENDFIYQFTQANPPDNMICERVNYTDLPRDWVSEEIRTQAERMKINNPDLYKNIWLGEPSKGGKFFSELGDKNKEKPFKIPADAHGRVWLSLDHGISHPTSAGIWYLDSDGTIHRVCSYLQRGGTTEAHARAIWEMCESTLWLNGVWPDAIYFDPSMETKRKLSEAMYESDIDVYKKVFFERDQSKHVAFYPANNRKIDGCHIMREVFSDAGKFRYFDGLNFSFVDGINFVQTDENNIEIYAKQDGDDATDEARYGIVAGYTNRNNLIKKIESDRNRLEREREQRLMSGVGRPGRSWMGV